MKRTLILLALVLLAGCSGQTGTTPPAGNTGTLMVTGQVQNWQSSYGSSLIAESIGDEILGTGAINSSGDFSIIVSPPVFTLGPVEPCESSDSTLVSTPASLRAVHFNLFIAEQEFGSVERVDAEEYTNRAVYMYADQAGTVQGQSRCVSEFFDNTIRYDLELFEGWNLVNINFQDVGDSSAVITWTSATDDSIAAYTWQAYIYR